MINESGGFTDDAYFPKLRKIISPDLKPLSLNPFSNNEFEHLWRTFEKEIKSIDGYTDGVTITFSFDFPKGKNKNRLADITSFI